eukprot:scaffold6307_cov109-Skeletonema_dohrnii-CCMP3373.AAC.1
MSSAATSLPVRNHPVPGLLSLSSGPIHSGSPGGKISRSVMDAKLSHCFSSDCISADAGVTDGGVDLAFDPPKPPPPPLAFFFCFFAAYKAVIGLECCGKVKAAEWLAEQANHMRRSSGDVAIMVMVSI